MSEQEIPDQAPEDRPEAPKEQPDLEVHAIGGAEIEMDVIVPGGFVGRDRIELDEVHLDAVVDGGPIEPTPEPRFAFFERLLRLVKSLLGF